MSDSPCGTCKYENNDELSMTCRDCGAIDPAWGPNNWVSRIEFVANPTPEYTGGSVSYYTVEIINPTNTRDKYTAECNDIIEALGMNYAEGNAFKAIWRRCAARMGKSKAGYKDGLYDAEKVVFFGERMVAQEKFDK